MKSTSQFFTLFLGVMMFVTYSLKETANNFYAVFNNSQNPPGVEISANDNDGTAAPSEDIVYAYTVTNTGTITDTFTVMATSNQGFLVLPNTNSLELEPNESTFLFVTVTIPPTATVGVIDSVTVEVTSDTPPNPSNTASNETTVITGVAIEPETLANIANPGEDISYLHTVTNTGNEGHTFDFMTSDDTVGFLSSVNPSAATLSPSESMQISLTVSVPTGAPAGVMNETTLVVAAQSGPPSISDSAIDTTTVNVVYGVMLESDEEQVGHPGQIVSYLHTITNAGNITDSFDITFISSVGFPVSLSTNHFTLSPHQTSSLTVDVTVPVSATSGEEDTLIITATSNLDPTVYDSSTDITTVGIQQIYLPLLVTPVEWEQIAVVDWPSGARALSLDVCVQENNQTIIFAGTDEFLWKLSGNNGQSINAIPANTVVTDIVITEACDEVFVSTFTGGVWHGIWQANDWNWSELNTGENIDGIRSLVLASGILFAGSDSGIHYWQDSTGWNSSTLPGSNNLPIMDMSVANPSTNTGAIYAVQWLNPKIFENSTPSSSPATWSLRNDIADSNDISMRAIFGNANGVQALGTSDAHYELNGSQWALVRGTGLRAYVQSGNRHYVGYVDGLGVYVSATGNNYKPFNNGWTSPPDQILILVVEDDFLYAGTTTGVWQIKLP